ncbi:MAG: RDD family protein [Opitutaceae bacterium]
MKSSLRLRVFLPALLLAIPVVLNPQAFAQPPAEPPVQNAEKATPTPGVDPQPPAEPAEAPPLRRLDVQERSAADAIRARADDIRKEAEETRRRFEEQRQRQRQLADEARARARERHTGYDVVNVFGDSTLPAGERADNVVAVFGSVTSEGSASESVVSVFGNNRVTGPVGEDVVAVFGNVHVSGRVGEHVVAVFGNVTINSRVGRVVTVFGNVKLGPQAEVDQEVVSVMGGVEREPGAIVHRQVNSIGRNFPLGAGIGAWFRECLRWGRPLAFASELQWAWIIAFSFLGFYLLLALLFRGGIEKCTLMLETKPGASALTALGAVVLTPVAFVLLVITVVGIVVVPFLGVGLFFAGLFGKAVVLAWIGGGLLKRMGSGGGHPVLAVLVGGLVVLGIYTVPFLGFLSYKLFGWLGLGVVLYTLLSSRRREKSPAMTFGIPAAAAGIAGMSAAPAMGVTMPGSFPTESPGFGASETSAVPPMGVPMTVPLPPSMISAASWPRAGFWIRFGGLLLDLLLLGFGVALATTHGELAPFGIAAYTAIMWKLKATTIGGIACRLKVVRLDGRELDWTTAVVRSLACFLSFLAFGLGFIWVAIDDEKQSWHDKIAGTTVVRVPRGVSLL